MAGRPLVYIARHGETTLNGRHFRGSTDVSINEKGRDQAETLATFFGHVGPLAAVVSSDTRRARETTQIIDAGPATEDPRLRALDVGNFSGQPKTKENVQAVESAIASGRAIPGGESLAQFQARVHPALQQAVGAARTAGRPVLLVAHSSVVHEAGNLFNGDHTSALVKPGGVAVIDDKLRARAVMRPGEADSIAM